MMRLAYVALILSLILFAAFLGLFLASYFHPLAYGNDDRFVIIAGGAARIIQNEPLERTYIPLIYPPIPFAAIAAFTFWRIKRRSPKLSGFPI